MSTLYLRCLREFSKVAVSISLSMSRWVSSMDRMKKPGFLSVPYKILEFEGVSRNQPIFLFLIGT